MRPIRGILPGMILLRVACVAMTLGWSAGAQAGGLGLLVPAYFYPGTGGAGGVGDGWAQMASAASEVSLTAIVNPDSGPLPGLPDPNYVNAMTNLEAAGGHVIAYVATGYTTVPLATVEGEITTYITQYGSLINGFFIDQMTNDASQSDLAYYHSLYLFIKGLSPAYQVTGNPGTATVPNYLQAATQGADTLVTYENDDQAHPYSQNPPPSWVYGYPPSHFASVIYNEPTAQGMVADLHLALQYNVGNIFVTDQNLPNPYAELPSYWNQEVAAVASVPEPGSFTLLASSVVAVWLALGIGRRKGRRAV
jgi:Spherulation-specific family 4